MVERLIYGEKNISWKLYFDYCCESIGGRLFFLCDYEVSIMNLKIPHFYLEMLRAWQEIRKCRFPDIESLNPVIFNNRKILLKGKIIFVESLNTNKEYI